jgi:Zn-dependent M28 family amino/carboxypeptidase
MPKEFYSNEAFNRSDQIAFAKAGIPSILILDSPEYKNLNRNLAVQKIIYYNEEVYHSPFDDLSININYKAAAQHVNIISAFVFEIAFLEKKVEWNDNVQFNYTRLQTIAEKR